MTASRRPSSPGLTPRQLTERAEAFLVWGVQAGWELLGQPVNILFTQEGLGFTHPPRLGRPVEIYVNPQVLKEPRGVEYLKGLMVHELGHHAAHFSDPAHGRVQFRAQRKGLASLLNLLQDEHLERRLRRFNPQWGECLDALASWSFKGEPLRISLEKYAVLLGLPDAASAAVALVDGIDGKKTPGRVVMWQFGYLLADQPGGVLSFPDFVQRLFQELERRHPDKRLPEELRTACGELREKAGRCGRNPEGVLEVVLSHPTLSLAEEGRRQRARTAIAQFLEIRPGEKDADVYLGRVREVVTLMGKPLPGLERYLRELEWTRNLPNFTNDRDGSFWRKQRTMIWNMRRGYDFTNTFLVLPERSKLSDPILKILKEEGGTFMPALAAREIVEAWGPEVVLNERRPHLIHLTWSEALESRRATSVMRFTAALRMAATHLLEKDPAAREAWRAVPKDLIDLDVSGVYAVVRKVAAILGFEASRKEVGKGKGRGGGSGVGAKRGEGGESDLAGRMARQLERQRGCLSMPLKDKKDPHLADRLREAERRASERLDRWLRSRGRLAESIFDPASRRPEVAGGHSEGYDRIEGPPAKGREADSPRGARISQDLLNIARTCEFEPISRICRLGGNAEGYRALVRTIYRHVRIMDRYFADLGSAEVEVPGRLVGRRVDPLGARRLAILGDPHIMVGRERRLAPDLFIGVVIDCSGSMSCEDRMEKARAFGALILEAAKGRRGIEARAVGFTSEEIFDLGKAGDPAIIDLIASGGNNDAAGLLHGARLALLSGKRHALLVMISDGYPTECSFESLCALVIRLKEKYGIHCAQVAVAPLDKERIAFPHFTDLTDKSFSTAVAAFGRMIQRLIRRHLDLSEG